MADSIVIGEGSAISVDSLGRPLALYGPSGRPVATTGALRFCLPGRNISGAFTDISDNTATATVDAGNTGAFATANYMASIAAVNGGLTVPNAKVLWNPRTESLILGFVIKRAVPASGEVVCAWSGGAGAGQTGFYISHRSSTGALKIVPTIAGAVVNAQADSTLPFSDGAPQDRHCTVAYDSTTGIFSIYRDGVLSNSFSGTPMIGASLYPDANITHEYRIGGTAGGSSVTTVATLTYGHQGYVLPGALPTHIGRIAAILAENPRVPLNILTVASA